MDIAQRRGIRLDLEQLDHQLALRGISVRDLARRAGIPENSLSRARRNGVRESTLKRLTTALLSFPLIEGAELIVARPTSRVPEPVKQLEVASA